MEQAQHAIDLTRHHFKKDRGDLSMFGTWLWNDDQEAHEPALVIVNRYNPRAFKPCVVALSAAYKYNDARYMARIASAFTSLLGLQDGLVTAHKLALFIEDHLNDLLLMPPNPTTTIVVADAIIDSGRRKMSAEIVEHVSLKQS